MNIAPDQEILYRVLTLLSRESHLSQREMARQIGISLGKMNHFVVDLSRKGLILVHRTSTSGNRMRCHYLLTPSGLEEKASLALNFLKAKIREYEKVREQIRELAEEVGQKESLTDLEAEGSKVV